MLLLTFRSNEMGLVIPPNTIMNEKINGFDSRLVKMDQKIQKLEKRIEELEKGNKKKTKKKDE